MNPQQYSESLRDPRWQKKRLAILKRDGWACQKCGAKDKPLNVHHLKYSGLPWESPNKDLLTVCEGCHEAISHSPARATRALMRYARSLTPLELGNVEIAFNGFWSNGQFGTNQETRDHLLILFRYACANLKTLQVANTRTLKDAVAVSLSKRIGRQTLFLYARAIKAMEHNTGIRLKSADLDGAFNLWWATAKAKLPPDAEYYLYLSRFTYVYSRAKVPLHVDPIEEAISYANKTPIPAELGPTLGYAAMMCKRLQEINGEKPFFISMRDVAKALNHRTNYDAAALLFELERQGWIKCVAPGSGRKANRYRYLKP